MLKKGFALLLILPLGFVLFNNTANRHEHQLPNGMVVEHAHPVSSCCSGETSHDHNDLEFLLLSLISDSPFSSHLPVVSPLFVQYLETEFKAAPVQIAHTGNSCRLSLLRAPPPFINT